MDNFARFTLLGNDNIPSKYLKSIYLRLESYGSEKKLRFSCLPPSPTPPVSPPPPRLPTGKQIGGMTCFPLPSSAERFPFVATYHRKLLLITSGILSRREVGSPAPTSPPTVQLLTGENPGRLGTRSRDAEISRITRVRYKNALSKKCRRFGCLFV